MLDESEYWAIRAAALGRLERVHECLEAAQQGLERDPDDVELLGVFALCQLQLGNQSEAERVLARASALAPDNPNVLTWLALLHASRGYVEAAHDAVSEVLRAAPDSAEAQAFQAVLAVDTARPEAEAYVSDLLALEPEDPSAHAMPKPDRGSRNISDHSPNRPSSRPPEGTS